LKCQNHFISGNFVMISGSIKLEYAAMVQRVLMLSI